MLLPEPLGPTMAVVSPPLIVKFMFYRTFLTCSGAVGYLKVMSLKEIERFTSNFSVHLSWSRISGTLSITSKTVWPITFALIIACMFGVSPNSIIMPMLKDISTERRSPAVYSCPPLQGLPTLF